MPSTKPTSPSGYHTENPLTDGASQSLWSATEPVFKTAPLGANLNADVCVVGGGLGGITTAYLLQLEGKKVCLLESFGVGSGQTGRTTAHFVTALDDRYVDLEKYHGKDGSKLAADSHQAALDQVAAIVSKEKIECDFKRVTGYLYRSPDTKENILEEEFEAAQRAGLKNLSVTEINSPTAFLKGKALVFPDQIQVHPTKYLNALAKIFIARGGLLFTDTPVASVKGGSSAHVETKSGKTVECKSIVVATNSPINDLFAIHTKQSPYRSYVLGFEVPKDSVDEALYWDTTDPYHYVRLQGDTLVVGGEDHKTGQHENPDECFERLETWTRKHLPSAGRVTYRWSGQVMEPVDGLAFLGHNPLDRNNVFIITGDSGNGMTHCTIGAMLIRDQILGRPNAWESLYQPSRVSPRAFSEFAKENANVAVQYADWAKPHHSPDEIASIAKGEGIIVRDGMKILAVSKDEAGDLQAVSAVCTHLGGIVHWNTVEKTWDCPCHGSRFSPSGQVVEGPAFLDLPEVSSDTAEAFAKYGELSRRRDAKSDSKFV